MSGRVLVIGASGLVGRHVVEVLGPTRALPTYRGEVAGGLRLDITDQNASERVIANTSPSAVVLAAADAYVERCEAEPLETRRINVDAAAAIARASRAVGARLVVFSSEYVFDGSAGAYDEDDTRHPINEYGRQKVELEDIARTDPRALICRTSGVFGPDPRGKNFVMQLCAALRAGKPFEVPTDQLITPTAASSLARAVIALCDRGNAGTYHVAGPEIMARVEFALLVAKTYGLPAGLITPRTSKQMGLRAERPPRAGLRIDKLVRTIGPVQALGDALRAWDPFIVSSRPMESR